MSSMMSKQAVNDYSLLEFIYVMGGPGAGKGTQCLLLAKKYGFWRFSLGNILRAEASIPKSKWGDVIRRNIQEGALAGDLNLQHILVDGFPRNFDRAQFFEQEVAVPLCILLLKYPDNVLRQRLRSRAETGGHSDDNDQAIDGRIAVLHHDKNKQVLDYYAQRSKLVHVGASVSQLDVLANVDLGLGEYLWLVPSGSADSERSETATRKRKRTASELEEVPATARSMPELWSSERPRCGCLQSRWH